MPCTKDESESRDIAQLYERCFHISHNNQRIILYCCRAYFFVILQQTAWPILLLSDRCISKWCYVAATRLLAALLLKLKLLRIAYLYCASLVCHTMSVAANTAGVQPTSTTVPETTAAPVDNGHIHPATDDQSVSPLVASLAAQIEASLQAVTAPHPELTPELILAATQAALNSLLETHYQTHLPSTASLSHTTSSTSSAPRAPVRTYIDGCFDIMHSGHYNAIRQAKALTDILVVGVHSDDEILKHKGPPVMNNEERLATVRACKWVDEVVFDTPYNPSLALLDKLHCEYVVHGDDMSTTADGKDAYEEVKLAGRMKIVKRTEGISTTDLVGRLLLMTKQHHIIVPEPSMSPRSGAGVVVSTSPTSRAGGGSTVPGRKSSVPSFLLDHPPSSPSKSHTLTLTPSSQPRSLNITPTGTTTTPTATAPSPVRIEPAHPQVVPAAETAFASKGISNFLPTTWRIAQFSNNRTPQPTDTVVYIDGAFDLFHVGHIETLKKAKSQGSFLYVGLHDDNTINAHRGKNYPIMNLHERCMNVLSCKYVDEVVIGAPWKCTRDLINTLGVHVVVSGSNSKYDPYRGKEAAAVGEEREDCYAEVKAMGIYREIDTSYLLETEDVVERIVENRLKYEKRNAKRSVKEKDYLTGQKQYVAEI